MKKKVLIVDDQAEIRKLVRLTVGPAYETREASNGIDAVAMARDFQPDVVLLDVMMPGGVDGYEVCRSIRQVKELAATKVIMLTARGQQRDIDDGRRAGADEFMVKPFSPLALMACIERLVGAAGGSAN